MHADAVAFANVPTGHVVEEYGQLVEPCALSEPAAHGRHNDDELAPVPVPYVPAGQGMHTELQDAPTNEEYVPAGQAEHDELEDAPITKEYVPAAQGIAVTEESGQYEPEGQMTGTPDEQ